MISGKSPGHSRNLYEATFDRATLIINSLPDRISSYLTLSHLISSFLISSHLISSYFIVSHLFSFYLILSHLISSYLILSHLISSYIIYLSINLSVYVLSIYIYISMHLISGPLALLPSPTKTHVNHTSLPTRRDQVGDEYHGVHIWSAVLMGTWQ